MINNFFDSEVAIACMDKQELLELTEICEQHHITWTDNSLPSDEFPITVYYDDACSIGRKYLNYTSGEDYLQDWGIPIVEFSEIQLPGVLECTTFLELL